ncbi:MAG: TonB family protein [Ignavibacteria bacterium]|nr:TonB family protein [Ignavibacteria bacterium]
MTRQSEISTVQIQFLWNPNAIKGYMVAVGVLVVSLLISMCTRVEMPDPYALPASTPTIILSFGEGDGTGLRKGNLTAEGRAQRGKESTNPLEDASRAATSASGKNVAQDPTQSARLIATKDVGTKGPQNNSADPTDRTIGTRDGSDDGTGIGWAGSGKGKGLGYGDIDWGGGGNRIVLTKIMPKFPPGTLNTDVKLKFKVSADGTVSLVWPVRRGGEPAVDRAAMEALRQWKFNRLSSDVEMEGTITFVFRNS